VFEILLQNRAELDTRNKYSQTPLLLAAENDNSALIRFLLEHRADAKAATPKGSTVLHLLAECGGDSESAELLMAHGADPQARKSSGLTVLHSAFIYPCNNKPLIQKLVENGADVNAEYEGVKVLHLAAKNATGAIVKYLIEKGADVMAKTKKGSSVLHFATENEDPERIFMLLAKMGADIEEKDASGRTCLLRVNQPGCRLLVKFLVERGANVKAKSNGGNTILHTAEVLEDTELVKYLLEKGANAKAANVLGVSALHTAVEHGHEETVRLLV
jgi:ankyrin repeat protein